MIWFTSDTHFNHRKMLEIYPERGQMFNKVEDMNEGLIHRWNWYIKPNDVVYHLGDFGYDRSGEILSQLNGIKNLVPGNHDMEIPICTSLWYQVMPYSYQEIVIDGIQLVLSHYPIWEWNRAYKGSFHLHGHLHGKSNPIKGRIMDVGVDANDMAPVSWDTIKTKLLKIPHKGSG